MIRYEEQKEWLILKTIKHLVEFEYKVIDAGKVHQMLKNNMSLWVESDTTRKSNDTKALVFGVLSKLRRNGYIQKMGVNNYGLTKEGLDLIEKHSELLREYLDFEFHQEIPSNLNENQIFRFLHENNNIFDYAVENNKLILNQSDLCELATEELLYRKEYQNF